MKTQKIQNLLVVTLFCAAALAALRPATPTPWNAKGGKLPDKDGLENTYGMLRSTRSVRDEVRVFLTEGNGFVTDNFYYQLTKPLGSALSLEAAVKAGEGETERHSAARSQLRLSRRQEAGHCGRRPAFGAQTHPFFCRESCSGRVLPASDRRRGRCGCRTADCQLPAYGPRSSDG